MWEDLQVKRASCSQPSEIQLQHPFRWEVKDCYYSRSGYSHGKTGRREVSYIDI